MTQGAGFQEWTVPIEEEGERLDRFLAARVPEWSRSKLQAFIKQGLVEVGGRVQLKSGAPLTGGERVGARLPASRPSEEAVRERRLTLLFEDDDLLVVDKPAGLLTHRREGSAEVTLAELAVAHCGPLPSVQGEDRPGIVHRLDRETSGVVVLGKSEASLRALMAQFKAREVEKTYALLVAGTPRFASDWVEQPLGRDPRHPERMGVLSVEDGGRLASTYYEVVERFDCHAHLVARPKTGRTHQIRVHMNVAGLEILGDKIYRLRNAPKHELPEGLTPPRRQMLHAARLEVTHPGDGRRLTFEAAPPRDFQELLDRLRG
jgi:23S rRNA pseudouridine1911/1915/1917 synthase